MLLSLQSTESQHNNIQTNIQILWNYEYINNHVECINTRKILITTDEDIIEYEYNDVNGNVTRVTCYFPNRYHLTLYDITNILRHNDPNLRNVVNVLTLDIHHITITPLVNNFKFTKKSINCFIQIGSIPLLT